MQRHFGEIKIQLFSTLSFLFCENSHDVHDDDDDDLLALLC